MGRQVHLVDHPRGSVGPDRVDPRRYLRPARDAMSATVAHLLGLLARSAGSDPVASTLT